MDTETIATVTRGFYDDEKRKELQNMFQVLAIKGFTAEEICDKLYSKNLIIPKNFSQATQVSHAFTTCLCHSCKVCSNNNNNKSNTMSITK